MTFFFKDASTPARGFPSLVHGVKNAETSHPPSEPNAMFEKERKASCTWYLVTGVTGYEAPRQQATNHAVRILYTLLYLVRYNFLYQSRDYKY